MVFCSGSLSDKTKHLEIAGMRLVQQLFKWLTKISVEKHERDSTEQDVVVILWYCGECDSLEHVLTPMSAQLVRSCLTWCLLWIYVSSAWQMCLFVSTGVLHMIIIWTCNIKHCVTTLESSQWSSLEAGIHLCLKKWFLVSTFKLLVSWNFRIIRVILRLELNSLLWYKIVIILSVCQYLFNLMCFIILDFLSYLI